MDLCKKAGFLQIHQRAQRIPQIMIHRHIDRNLPDSDRTFDPHRNVIRIIGYPYRHFFAPFKYIPLDKQGLEFDSAELGVFRPDRFFTQVADI